MTLVKICGLTRPDDARAAVLAGADYLGLNFWPKSRRFLADDGVGEVVEAARQAARGRDRPVVLAGVFVNQDLAHMVDLAARVGLDCIQLHGDETPGVCTQLEERLRRDCPGSGVRVIKALAMTGPADVTRLSSYPCDTFLIDTPTSGYGGSGQTFDWHLAREAVLEAGQLGRQVFLAGGLHPGNVADAIVEVRPYGVDVASGVETAPGIKDHDSIQRFIEQARAANEKRPG